jgi:D-amino-acid oxidase
VHDVSVQRVVVVGAGVLGLTCAVRLAEAGHPVDVLARDLPLETTSAVAGGLWWPDLAEPAEDVVRWARASHTELTSLADDERSGVRVMPGQLVRRDAAAEPPWAAAFRGVVDVSPVAAPSGYARAWTLSVPLVDTGRYLPYLGERLRAAGGTMTRLPLPALPPRGLVVNCTGLAARALAADPTVRPVAGQVVVLDDPGLPQWWWCDEDGGPGPGPGGRAGELTSVLPRGRDVVVGGTAQDGGWDTTPDPATAEQILRRAVALVPELGGLRVRSHRVGLRPARPRIRLEVEHRRDDDGRPSPVVHCYGHGGRGVTMSWGCADDVLRLVSQIGRLSTAVH